MFNLDTACTIQDQTSAETHCLDYDWISRIDEHNMICNTSFDEHMK